MRKRKKTQEKHKYEESVMPLYLSIGPISLFYKIPSKSYKTWPNYQ